MVVTHVRLPRFVKEEDILLDCWTGAFGSQDHNCTTERKTGGDIEIRSGMINPGEGHTIAVGFPAGIIKRPSAIRRLIWFFTDNVAVLIALFLPIIVFILLLRKWRRTGRDPIDIYSGIVRYNPPDELLPAEAGSLWDETVDMRDITSTIIDLAVRGYIRIEELETDYLLFLKKSDYRIVQIAPFDNLCNFEISIMLDMMKWGTVYDNENNYKQVLISELKERFYTSIKGIKTSIMNSLVDKKCFDEPPSSVSSRYFILGGGIMGLGIAGGILMASGHLMLSAFISGIITMAFAKAMPRKTKKGANLARQILGFKEFVERVEKDRLEQMAKEDPTIFDRLLPYAMALGVEDHWASAFKDIYREPPDWYTGRGYGSAFRTAVFVDSLGNAMNTMGRTMSSVPRGSSSASSGGSAFSGGGGFSGGGFGGGGGGGW